MGPEGPECQTQKKKKLYVEKKQYTVDYLYELLEDVSQKADIIFPLLQVRNNTLFTLVETRNKCIELYKLLK